MCQKCVDAVKQYWPNIKDDKIGDFLINNTCFGFGSVEQVIKQIKELAERSNGDLKLAHQIVEEDIDKCMEYGRITAINESWPPGRVYYKENGYRNPAWCT